MYGTLHMGGFVNVFDVVCNLRIIVGTGFVIALIVALASPFTTTKKRSFYTYRLAEAREDSSVHVDDAESDGLFVGADEDDSSLMYIPLCNTQCICTC